MILDKREDEERGKTLAPHASAGEKEFSVCIIIVKRKT
jgi:hypothetical protein